MDNPSVGRTWSLGSASAILVAIGFALGIITKSTCAQQTNNYILRTVPTPGNVVINGRLDDWELSGEILMCYDVGSLLDVYSAKAAAMYDSRGFYLSLRVRDRTPMQNTWDPVAQPFQGWRGDCAQIYFWDEPGKPYSPNGSRVAQLTVWYYSKSRQPAASMLVGPIGHGRQPEAKLTNLVGRGVELAFQKENDGKGYIVEMRIDWKLLSRGGQAYHSGEAMGIGLEIFWGNPQCDEPEHRLTDLLNPKRPQRTFFWSTPEAWGTVRFMPHGNLPPSVSIKLVNFATLLERKRYSTSGQVEIRYTLPADGFATLVIEDKQGSRIRNLISDYPRQTGENIDYWDGRDDAGRLVEPGEYRVRGLFHKAFDLKYEFAFGNPANPPWPTSDGRGGWLSNHCNNIAVLADDERIYATAPESEGPYPLIALDYDGNKVWGGLSRWYAGYMARCGKYLYIINDKDARPASKSSDLDEQAPIELIRIAPDTGKEVPFPDGHSKHVIAMWNVQKQGTPKKWEGWTIAHHAHDADWTGTDAAGIAAVGGTLYVSLHFDNKLLKVDAETGKVVGEIPIAHPAGVVSDDRRLLAISGAQVMQIDPVNGKITPLISADLKAPIDLAVGSNGKIYVSDWADQMCVKVFSSAGKYLKHIGKLGGRPWIGSYDPQGMLLPRGITIDKRGRLWVAEFDFSPRRISCWDTRTGKLVLERLGRGRYGGMGYYVLPDQPGRGILNNNLLELDWKRGRWRVLSTLWRATRSNEALGADPYTRLGRIIHYMGRRFLIQMARRPQGGPVIISELKGNRAIPLAAVGYCGQAIMHVLPWTAGMEPNPVFASHLWTDARMDRAAREIVPWFFYGPRAGDLRAVAAHYHRWQIWTKSRIGGGYPKTNGAPNANFIWCDINGNGCIETDEITYFATPGLNGPLPLPWHAESWSGGVADDRLTLYVSAVQDGRSYHFRLPVSRWSESGAPIYRYQDAALIVSSPYLGEAAWINDRGELLALGNIGNPERHGLRDPLVAYKPDGSIAWTYPSDYTGVHGSHTAPKEKRGLLIGPLGVIGSAKLKGVGQIFAFHTNMGTAEIFTSDGLYVGRLFKDCRSAPDPWPDRPRRGISLKNVTNGGEWFGGQFFQHPDTGQVYVICSRFAGAIVRVTGLDSVERLKPWRITFSVEQYQQAQKQFVAKEHGTEKKMTVTRMKRPAPGIPRLDAFIWDAEHAAHWRYDAKRSAMATWRFDQANLYVAFQVQDETPMINSGEDVRRLFKFGDAALLELRTRPNDGSKEILPGDIRLLFSIFHGKPVAVLYDYRHPGVKEPVIFRSVKDTRIDRIQVLKAARILLDRAADSYVLRAVVPFESLGFHPQLDATYSGDFGIIYSDKTGTTNQLRMNWSNKATGIVSDLSMEADIVPRLWGRFEVR